MYPTINFVTKVISNGVMPAAYLINFTAKLCSFPVATAAASINSKLFSDIMWHKTPKRASWFFV